METAFYEDFPELEVIESEYQGSVNGPLAINAHIHTPYSFSCFEDMGQIFEMAYNESIQVLGINDFYTASGYSEFAKLSIEYGIFPIFNMEFIGLDQQARKEGIRINDPENPGRIYLCGKGFSFPFSLPLDESNLLKKVVDYNYGHLKTMIAEVNKYFKSLGFEIVLDLEMIQKRYAKDLVRERHIASAIREGIERLVTSNSEKQTWEKILQSDLDRNFLTDPASLENLIRSKILKKGGPGYIEETDSGFLPVQSLLGIIKAGGGIPCYPVLLDNKMGAFTEFENDWPQLALRLQELDIPAVELIPKRNDRDILHRFVKFFDQRGFLISFGTEHNTPQIEPLSVLHMDRSSLDSDLKGIGLRATAVYCAHQYLRSKGLKDFNSDFPNDLKKRIEKFESLGLKVLNWYFNEHGTKKAVN